MINDVKKAVVSRLLSGTALTALLAHGSAVYYQLAPSGAAMPYVVFTYSSGGDMNITPRDEFEVTVQIKGVATSPTVAGSISDAVRTLMHNGTLTYEHGWVSVWNRHTGMYEYLEQADRAQYWHSGGLYRLRAVKQE